MAGLVGKLVFNRILKETRENNQGRDDPYFENVPTKKLSTFSGKPRLKRRHKALPPGLSEKDEKTLVKVKRRAYRLDMALGTCCGFKIGWGSVIGLFPAIGDVLDTLLALMVVRTASEVGLPSTVIIRMLFNIAFDFIIGLVPLLGDIADAAYKANTRNAIVLEDYLRTRGQMNLKKQGKLNEPDYSLGDVDVEEGVVTEPPIRQPQPSYQGDHSSRGWTGSHRQHDVEAQRGPPMSGSKSKSTTKSKPKTKGQHSRLKSDSIQETGTT